MGLMEAEVIVCGGNAAHWWNQNRPSFPSHTCSDIINWETAAVHMSLKEEAIRKATVRFNPLMKCYGCI